MRKLLLALAATSFMGLAQQAQAVGLFVEPYLGYDLLGEYEFGTNDGDYTSVYLGGRIGAQGLGGLLFIGADVMLGQSGTFKDVVGSADIDVTRQAIGAVVGARLPLIDAWLGYNFSDSITRDEGNFGNGEDSIDGSSVKVGVGLGLLPLVNINLEYITYTDDDDSVDLDATTYLVSVSLPLSL